MVYKKIMGIIPGLQATALVGENLKVIKNFGVKKSISPKKIVKLGVVNLVGVGLIKPTAKMISEL